MKKIVLLLMLGVSPATATIPSWAVISYPDPDNDKFRVIDFPPNFCYGTLWKSETGGRWNHQVYLESPFGQRCYVGNVELLRRIMSVCPVLYDCVLKGDIRLARNEFIEAHWSSVNVPMTSAIKDWLVLWMDVGSAC